MEKLRAHKISQLRIVEPSEAIRSQALAAMSAVDPDKRFMQQPDLLYVEAVLVTEGINDNDDAFTHAELWKAQASPMLKPINIGHNDSQILGVMYGVSARKLDSTPMIEDDGSPFELVMHGVVWHYLPHLRGVAQQITEKFAQGQCYVSMECWFEGYDYGLYDDDNLADVVARCDDTAYLEQHLRVRGGSGKLNATRIGRALRGITFGGVAFVDVPANRRSDVLNVFMFDPDKLETDDIVNSKLATQPNDNVVLFEEGSMNDTTKKAVAHADGADVRNVVAEGVSDALTRERERAQAENQAQELDTARAKVADLEKQLEEAQAALARAHDAVENGYQTVRTQAGATGNTPEEIARIDRAKDGNDAFQAKIAFIAQTGGRAQANVAEELKQLREERDGLKAQVREHTRAGEIRETFEGILADEEIDGLVKSGLSKSDEDYTAWIGEHKMMAAKHQEMFGKEEKNGKNGKKDEKKGKARVMTPADETEKLADHGVKLDPKHGKVPTSVPSKTLAGGEVDLTEHFESVEEDVNLEGADATTAEQAEESGNPFDKVIAEMYTKPRAERRQRLTRTHGAVLETEGGN